MAYDNDVSNQPLLSGLSDPSPQSNQKIFKRGRYRRSRSAPIEFIPLENNGGNLLPPSKPIFTKLDLSFKQVAFFLVIYLGVGTLCFYLVKDQIRGEKTNGILDAVYFCIVTMTTVGYGDLVPDSVPTKLLACAFVFLGMALVAIILSKSADYLVEKQETLLVKALHMNEEVGEREILKEIEANKVKYKFLLTLGFLSLLIIVGTIFLSRFENLDLVDAFYCVCSTITTLGYGDKSFSTKVGRIFAIFWILTSTICLAQFFLYLAELYTEGRQHELVKWVLKRRMTYADLEAADIDDDNSVSAAEFILFKLKEMGMISQQDIALVKEEFEKFDIDQSGTLSASDITLAQPSQPES